jgi:hypothetical protein
MHPIAAKSGGARINHLNYNRVNFSELFFAPLAAADRHTTKKSRFNLAPCACEAYAVASARRFALRRCYGFIHVIPYCLRSKSRGCVGLHSSFVSGPDLTRFRTLTSQRSNLGLGTESWT